MYITDNGAPLSQKMKIKYQFILPYDCHAIIIKIASPTPFGRSTGFHYNSRDSVLYRISVNYSDA